ncbi:MAG: DNA repair protein RecN [Deltaproteobacteria bacterium]|nr:DNA repair protein RecN [Deltaproteobacteria bacterium]
MLLELRIKNFAIIDSLSLSFGHGLNIFTGETGAGKSIIIDAISLILGDRATNELIRTSAEEAEIEALFEVTGRKGISNVLKEAGLSVADNLIIKRVVQRAGRNKIYINGSLATLVTLTEVGRRLIDIYGQSEHQSLARPEEHIEVLDAFGNCQGQRAEMAEAYRAYAALKKEFDSLSQDSRRISERSDMLSFQSKEIEDAALKPGEEEVLKKEKERLSNAEKIKSAVDGAERALYSDAGSIVERLGSVIKPLKDAAIFDDKLRGTVEALEGGLYQFEDSSAFLRNYGRSVEYDAAALDAAGERLDIINRLKKKYGGTVDEVLLKKAEVDTELLGLTDVEERLKGLSTGVKAARDKAISIAGRLHEARLKAVGPLKKKVEEELQTLGMKGTVFEAAIEEDLNPNGGARFGEKGSDRVSFFITPNPGEDVKPLSRIASGGELSRIMLAMKRVTAAGRVPTLIFDEIDAGVGGAAAEAVGLKLKEVSSAHQVICITHLPQIAAFAGSHYLVSKETAGGRTTSSIAELKGEERIGEIARMLAGAKVTDTTRKQAKELVSAARGLSEKAGKG